MKVYKYGGNILKDKETRLQIYKKIKQEKDKLIIVVSAFKDSPYSSDSLSKLIENYQDINLYEHMVCLGEIISSLIICNELKQLYVNADVIYPEEIGINIEKNDNHIQIIDLNNNYLLEKLKNCDVIIFPGFISLDQNNKFISLNRGGSDLSSILVAKMLNIEKVTLFKDVIGVCKCDPHLNQTTHLIEHISYDRLLNFCKHGCNIIQNEALKYAKQNNIKIIIKHYALDNKGTLIDDKKGDSSLGIHQKKEHIYIDGFPLSEQIKNLLFKNEIAYDLLTNVNDSIDIKTSFNNENEIYQLVCNHLLR